MTQEKKFFVCYISRGRERKSRWYIFWYEPHPKHPDNPKAFVRRKVAAGLNQIASDDEKEIYCQELIKKIVATNFSLGKKIVRKREGALMDAIKARQMRIGSERNYIQELEKLQDFFKKDLLKITNKEAYFFLQNLVDNYNSNTTINNKISALKTIYNYAKKRKLIEVNPFEGIDKLPESRQGFKPFKKAEMVHVLSELKTKDYEVYIACLILYFTMVRPNELRLTKISDFDFDAKELIIESTINKVRKLRRCKLPEQLCELLQNYFAGKNPNCYVLGFNLKPIKKNDLTERHNAIIRTQLHYSDLHSFYGWKNTGGVEYYKATKDILGLMHQMGHSDIKTTWGYIKRMDLVEFEGLAKHSLPSTIEI